MLLTLLLFSIDQIAPSNDEEQNKRHRKRLESTLAKLQRNKDRRLVRKALKAGVELPKSQLSTGDKKKSNKGVGKGKSTTRKCATCGAIGHIRTKYVFHYLMCS
jgi:transcription initiation factor TFIID subunit 1